ncbi:MAG: FAD-binding oxidoreductase [Thermoleophilia bacterium]|jgi:hypothetical protein
MVTEKQLEDVVGQGNVTRERSALEAYASDQSFVDKRMPWAIAKVNNVDVLQNLVKMAKETGTPLIPVSSGAPHFNGDTVPTAGGAVIVDLSGMKKIIDIDVPDRNCTFEAGVTFGELSAAVAEKGRRLNMPLAPRATKSVVGSYMSLEPVIMPKYHWDITDPAGGFEVVWGTGEYFRTGGMSGPGTLEQQKATAGIHKTPAGPASISFHRLITGAQGTMAIAATGQARLELLPSLEHPCFVGNNDLSKLQDIVHWLVRKRISNECLILDATSFAALVTEDATALCKTVSQLPRWILFFNLAAYARLTEMRMNGLIKDATELVDSVGLESVQAIGGVTARDFLELIRHPSSEPYWKLRSRGACQDIYFITTPAKIPGIVQTMATVVKDAGFSTANVGCYIQPIVQGSNTHVEFNLFYDPEDEAESAIVCKLATTSIQPLIGAGAYFSRPFGRAAYQIMNRNAGHVTALRKVKDLVDPAGILNPGKLCF